MRGCFVGTVVDFAIGPAMSDWPRETCNCVGVQAFSLHFGLLNISLSMSQLQPAELKIEDPIQSQAPAGGVLLPRSVHLLGKHRSETRFYLYLLSQKDRSQYLDLCSWSLQVPLRQTQREMTQELIMSIFRTKRDLE